MYAASAALRPIGASHKAATLSLGNARLTQKRRPPASTSEMSEDTPPVRGVRRTDSPVFTRPMRRRGSIRSPDSMDADPCTPTPFTFASVGGAAAREIEDRGGCERAFAAREPADDRRGFFNGAEAIHRNFRAHVGDMRVRHLREDRRVDR